jgi:hypothetical protein
MNEPPTQLTDMPDPGLEPAARLAGQRERFLLWVDGVGGFLICLAPRVLLGHGALDSDVDVPILADISRHHAWLQRDAQGYVVEAIRPVQINQQTVSQKALVRPGDLITLGKSCQFAFAQAVPVSASARLDLVSGHRLWRALRGVLLMAETLVLGPGPAVHVQVPDLAEPLVLFRQKTGLAVHYPGKLWLNDQPAKDRSVVEAGTRITVEELSLTLERAW